MRKSILIITICMIIFCEFYLIYSNGSLFSIDDTKFRLSYNYPENTKKIPEEENGFMILKANYDNALPINLEGEYHCEILAQEVQSKIKNLRLSTGNSTFMWVKYDYNNKMDTIICFVENYRAIIILNKTDDVLTFRIKYTNSKIEFSNIDTFDVYQCKFTYSIPEVGGQNNAYEDPHQNEEQNNTILNKIFDIALQRWIEILLALLGSILVLMAVFLRASRLLNKKYKNNLKDDLFPREHMWFGNNTPEDIYVSIRIFNKNEVEEHNLVKYFSNVFLNEDDKNFAIIGNAGEGKTFSISKLALSIIECFSFDKHKNKKDYKQIKKLVPIILAFSELSGCKNDDDLTDTIYRKICKVLKIKRVFSVSVVKKNFVKAIKRFLYTGRFVILIDGYDEISNTDERLRFSSVLMDFMNEYNRCYYIITSRNQIYEQEPFTNILSKNTLYLSPLSREQIREFIFKWSFSANKSGTDLYNRIINSIQVENIVTNPLLLTMVTHTYNETDFVFTNSKIKLYKQCCNCLLNQWENRKFIFKRINRYKTIEDVELKIELLSIVAYYLFKNQCPYLSESVVLNLWSNHDSELKYFHGKSRYVLKDLINQSGLLEMIDGNNLRFKHRTFYEFFVALYLLKIDYDFDSLCKYASNEKNIIFFYLSMINNEEVVNNYIAHEIGNSKLIMDLMMERKITNITITIDKIQSLLLSIDYNEISNLQSIGYIASMYKETRSIIKDNLLQKLFETTNEQVKVNIIVGLMLFCEKEELYEVLKLQINSIRIDSLIQYSGDMINQLSLDILMLISSNNVKIEYLELLARTYRFEAIYNIYKNGDYKYKNVAIIGLLYMTRSLEIIDFLRRKKFTETVNDVQISKSRYLLKEYGWIDDELNESDKESLFLLIYLSKEIIKKGFSPKRELIDHKITFLISYILSNEMKTVYDRLLKSEGFIIKDLIELSYHWNKRKRSNHRFLLDAFEFHSINRLNSLIVGLVSALIFIQYIIQLLFVITINEKALNGWIIKYSILKNFSSIPFNSLYMVFIGLLFLANWCTNCFIKRIKYGMVPMLLSVVTSLLISTIYVIVVPYVVLRILTIIVIMSVGCIEVLKHRNNYPSFKEPQYSRMINYLN